MRVLSDGRLRWLIVALAVVVLAGVGVGTVGLFAVVSALAAASADDLLLFVALEAAFPYVLVIAALAAVGAGFGGWLVVRAVRLAELPRSDRLERIASFVERHSPWLREVGVSDRVSPTAADRRDDLKERYARGELSEREFERELERLLADEPQDAEDVRADEAWSSEFDDAVDREDANDAGSTATADARSEHESVVASDRERD